MMSRLIDRCIASKRAVLAATVLWIAAPVAFVLEGLPRLSVAISRSIPVAYEKRLGEFVLAQLSVIMIRDLSKEPTQRQQILQQRFAEMAKLANLPDAKLLIRNGPVNAMALPGNTVVLMDGLVKRLNDDQVMAVVAHELGHLHHRHVMQRIVSVGMMEGMIETMAGGNSQAAKVGSMFSSALLSSAFTREQEREADTYAIQLLKAQGESGLAYAQALQFFLKYEKQQGFISGGWASSHPSTQERLDKAMHEAGGMTTTVTCTLNPLHQPEFLCK
ncbi:M48 family metallopeptidase [Variovorax sp. PCZ-1]|uniref:M48 family metallopeptidase n=1 Tax=Variovorax sp. PCZ-1 TaxID=2835533 RepID=UPI001BCF80B5|nr:M48 family metallopeptidase [Variovorax sp. PCZ-1]MBS7807564.1 M48 family metallopeptidase [Variovorax sp. PCZ-1]